MPLREQSRIKSSSARSVPPGPVPTQADAGLCTHCKELRPLAERDHWKRCPEHPARLHVEELNTEMANFRRMLVDERAEATQLRAQLVEMGRTLDRVNEEANYWHEAHLGTNGRCADNGADQADAIKAAVAPHVCKCSNGPCPRCGGTGPEGEWFEGSEVECADCGAPLIVATAEPCHGSSTFEAIDEEPDEEDDESGEDAPGAVTPAKGGE